MSNRYAADKSMKFDTEVPWVIQKHPRRGAQKNLIQEVSYGQNSKWPLKLLTVDSKDTKIISKKHKIWHTCPLGHPKTS